MQGSPKIAKQTFLVSAALGGRRGTQMSERKKNGSILPENKVKVDTYSELEEPKNENNEELAAKDSQY